MRYPLRCDDETFKDLVKKHTNRAAILRELGYAPGNGATNRMLNKRVAALGLDTSHWTLLNFGRRKKTFSVLEVCTQESKASSYNLKKRLWKEKILKEECSRCGLGPEWQGEPLSLHLDHIDGCHTNNQLSNLRILCPNCHTQTPTYGTKFMKGTAKKVFCQSCGVKISSMATKCRPCDLKERPNPTKIEWPDHETLKLRVESSSFRAVAEKLGVSDAAIHKRLKARRNIPTGLR